MGNKIKHAGLSQNASLNLNFVRCNIICVIPQLGHLKPVIVLNTHGMPKLLNFNTIK